METTFPTENLESVLSSSLSRASFFLDLIFAEVFQVDGKSRNKFARRMYLRQSIILIFLCHSIFLPMLRVHWDWPFFFEDLKTADVCYCIRIISTKFFDLQYLNTPFSQIETSQIQRSWVLTRNFHFLPLNIDALSSYTFVEPTSNFLLVKTASSTSMGLYRVFSLTWPASMQIYWNKRKRLHKKKVQLPEDWFGTTTWPPFHCFGTPIWPP